MRQSSAAPIVCFQNQSRLFCTLTVTNKTKGTMETQSNPNELGKPSAPGQQGGQQEDRDKQERERQQREREKQGGGSQPGGGGEQGGGGQQGGR